MAKLYYMGLALLFCFIDTLFVSCANDCRFTKYTNHTLFGHNTVQYRTDTAAICARYCAEETKFKCLSFDFMKDTSLCSLSNTNKLENPDKFGDRAKTDYYELDCITGDDCNYQLSGKQCREYEYLQLHQLPKYIVYYDKRFTAPGRLKYVQYQAHSKGNFTFGVWRTVSDGSTVKLVASVDIYTNYINGRVKIPETQNIYVQEGDMIGYYFKQSYSASYPRSNICTKYSNDGDSSRVLKGWEGDPSLIPIRHEDLNDKQMTIGIWATVECIDEYINGNGCPTGWDSKRGSCYKYITQPETDADTAAQKCLDLNPNSHLVALETFEECSFIYDGTRKALGVRDSFYYESSLWWTNGRRLAGTDLYYWENDSNKTSIDDGVGWLFWNSYLTEHYNKEPDRVMFVINGFKKELLGRNNIEKAKFICEID